jgi:hypothetical protein
VVAAPHHRRYGHGRDQGPDVRQPVEMYTEDEPELFGDCFGAGRGCVFFFCVFVSSFFCVPLLSFLFVSSLFRRRVLLPSSRGRNVSFPFPWLSTPASTCVFPFLGTPSTFFSPAFSTTAAVGD